MWWTRMGHWMMRFPARMDAAGAAKAKKDLGTPVARLCILG